MQVHFSCMYILMSPTLSFVVRSLLFVVCCPLLPFVVCCLLLVACCNSESMRRMRSQVVQRVSGFFRVSAGFGG